MLGCTGGICTCRMRRQEALEGWMRSEVRMLVFLVLRGTIRDWQMG